MDVDVFDRDFLLPFAAMAIEASSNVAWVRDSLFAWLKILFAAFKSLLGNHCPAVAFHCRVVRCEQLRRQHALQFVVWLYASEEAETGGLQFVGALRIGIVAVPSRTKSLIG